MADGPKYGNNREEELEEQIRRLQREKNDLERKKQLENERDRQRDNDLRSTKRQSFGRDNDGDTSDRRRNASDVQPAHISALEESQSHLKHLLNSTAGGASKYDRGINQEDESYHSSDDGGQDDDVMSQRHKQILRSNRDVLVENMTPDDIFNDLISKHVFTNADVSRIKEKNTLEAQNEELLNMLCRRSDRAFHVFTSSLRRTLQGWLANRLDPQAASKHKRKRRTGEMNLNVDCQEVIPSSRKRHACSCEEVEEQILQMAKGAFSKIRRRDTSASAHEQFRKELQQTNEIVKDSLEIVNSLKLLCRHGDVTNLSSGSICFTIRCRSLTACRQLWSDFLSGRLLAVCQRGLVTPALLRAAGAERVTLRLRMDHGEYLTCLSELGATSSPLSGVTIKGRLRQNIRSCDPQNENIKACPVYDELQYQANSSRKRLAFQEISPNTDVSSHGNSNQSSKKFFYENQNLSVKDSNRHNLLDGTSLPNSAINLIAKTSSCFTLTLAQKRDSKYQKLPTHSVESFIQTRTITSNVTKSNSRSHAMNIKPCRYNLRLKLR